MLDAISSTKLEQTGGNILGQPRLFECMGICVLSPVHESKTRSYLFYLLIVKYLFIMFKFSHSILDWTVLWWNFLGIFLKTFLEESVDLIIYRDYIVNRRFFIYCSLATWATLPVRATPSHSSQAPDTSQILLILPCLFRLVTGQKPVLHWTDC